MNIQIIWVLGTFLFLIGLFIGSYLRDCRWRECGNHAYKNRMESGGKLYQVKREEKL